MSDLQLVRLNNGLLNITTKAPGVSCFDVAGEDEEADQEPFGDVPLMQCLGVSSLPFPPDDSGHAEGVLIPDVGGLPGIVVAAWDTRTFSLFGNLEGGDTVCHSTGPAKAAQLLLKEKKRQAVLATKGSDGKQILVVLDGKNDQVQIMAFGHAFQITKADGIALEVGGCGITLHPDNGIHLRGAVKIGGMVDAQPTGQCMAVGSPAAWAAIAALANQVLIPIPNAMGAL